MRDFYFLLCTDTIVQAQTYLHTLPQNRFCWRGETPTLVLLSLYVSLLGEQAKWGLCKLNTFLFPAAERNDARLSPWIYTWARVDLSPDAWFPRRGADTVRGSGGMYVRTQVHARGRLCTRLLQAVPPTEVRRAPEQVQIELNLIPHCAATGMELRNCTLTEDRTAHLPRCSSSFSPPLDFFVSLCPLPKFFTRAAERDCLLFFLEFHWKLLIKSA